MLIHGRQYWVKVPEVIAMRKTNTALVKLVFLALLSAIVIIFQLLGTFINLGITSVSLVLVPIVIGAVMLGPKEGTWLGLLSGFVILFSGAAAAFFSLSPVGTVIVVLLKGALSGLAAALIYKALSGLNKIFASLVAAIVCPVVNTGIYVIGCLTVFRPFLSEFSFEGGSVLMFVLVSMVGLNFPFELLLNIVLSPVIIRISDMGLKKFNK